MKLSRVKIFFILSAMFVIAAISLIQYLNRSRLGTGSRYVSTALGFSMNMPDSWKEYQALEIATAEYRYVAFTVGDPIGSKAEFSIVRIDQPSVAAPAGAIALAERGSTRYVAVKSSFQASGPLEEPAAQIDSILATFKMEQ